MRIAVFFVRRRWVDPAGRRSSGIFVDPDHPAARGSSRASIAADSRKVAAGVLPRRSSSQMR